MKYIALLLFASLTIVSADQKTAEERLLDLNGKISALEARIEAHDKQEDIIYQMRDKELNLAASAVDKRLEAMNEVRGQLKDQAATFLLRNDYLVAHADVVKRLEQIELFQANQEGRIWMLGAGLTGFLAVFQGIGFYVLRKTK